MLSIRAVFVFNFLVYIALVAAVWTVGRRARNPEHTATPSPG
jgi:hypothetical protein